MMAPSQLTSQGHLMRTYYVAERAVYFSLAVFLLSILWFLLQYPITLSRNIIVHSLVFSVYFLGNTVLYLLLSMRGFGKGSLVVVTYALDAITLAAVGAWLVLLNPAGEMRKLSLRPQWMPGREEVARQPIEPSQRRTAARRPKINQSNYCFSCVRRVFSPER